MLKEPAVAAGGGIDWQEEAAKLVPGALGSQAAEALQSVSSMAHVPADRSRAPGCARHSVRGGVGAFGPGPAHGGLDRLSGTAGDADRNGPLGSGELMNSNLTLVGMLTDEKAVRRERQQDVPDSSGTKPFTFSIGDRDLQATNRKGADWKQILNKAKDFTGDFQQQFAAFKEWLESDWRGNAKRAVPTADPTTAAAEHAPASSKLALGQPPAKTLRRGAAPSACMQLQPRATASVAAPSALDAAPPSSGGDIPAKLAALLGNKSVRIRKTDETPPRISVIDVATLVTGKHARKAAQDVGFVKERYPEVAQNLGLFKFPGKAQRNTPVATCRGVVELVMLLPGRHAVPYLSAYFEESTQRAWRDVLHMLAGVHDYRAPGTLSLGLS